MKEVDQNSEVVFCSLSPNIDATLVTNLNLAAYQNAVPVLRELSISNESPELLRSLELRLESVPPFMHPKIWHIDAVGAGTCYRIDKLDVLLDGSLLTRLTEAETATVSFTLFSIDGSAPKELARLNRTVEILPRNQWGGLSYLPDLVAAFVQPNEPAVERLLKQAADLLRKNGKSSSLDGYRDGPKRAWELASGIWSAVAGMGLDYALPPASFEIAGQKVRSPAQIADSGLATCLDLALLFCAALEQAGLNPLLVFTTGHAFAGVWLKPEEFSTTVVDDVTALRKRLKLQELVLFETTLVTHRPAPAFSVAIQQGAQQISEDHDESFQMAVDIRRARLQRIKPLASAEATTAVSAVESVPVSEPKVEDAPDLPEEAYAAEPDPSSLSPSDRLTRWQRKLLDLSLRNNLLNFKAGKKSLRLEAPEAGAIEDVLSEGQTLKLLPRPDLMDGADPRDRAIYESREHEDVRRGHALDALARREVFVVVPKEELESRLVDLYRTARNTLQEGGANTLFLALGFLSWTRDDKTGHRYRAPLILVPVALNRRSARSGFTLTLHDDEPRFNPTLIEMLRQDFKLELGVADGELPRDDSGLDVTAIWNSVSHSIKDIKGWEVTEDVVLATFSFAKYLMWKDLVERTDQLRENAVVRHLIDSPREHFPTGIAFPAPGRLDHEYGPEQTFCPLPADSSQLSAVMAAAKGKDFVLIGPPGTGKSQTIANLIAQCLAEGKRVLFVSEKIAALDVVYRRLRDVGLGEFCLELHSSKARKADVLAQLQKSWDTRGEADPEIWRMEAIRLKRLRDELNTYVERLHLRYGNGLTIYQAIGCVAAGNDITSLGFRWSSPNVHDLRAMEAMREVVDRLEVNVRQIGTGVLLSHPLAAINHADWSPSWQQMLIHATTETVRAAGELEQTGERFRQSLGLPAVSLVRRVRGALAVFARILPHAVGHDWRFVLRPDSPMLAERLHAGLKLLVQHRALSEALSSPWPESVVKASRRGLELLQLHRDTLARLAQPWPAQVMDDFRKGLDQLEEIEQATEKLSVSYGKEVDQLNVIQLNRQWAKAEKSIWPLSWFRKRKVRKQLDAAVTGEGEADFAKDVRLLARIRSLKSEVSDLEMSTDTEGVWFGLKTRPESARSALSLQRALEDALHRRDWEDTGFEPVAEGRCGDRLARELTKLRVLKGLDAELISLDPLGPATGGLWAGFDTSTQRLEAALRFMDEVNTIREAGTLVGDHDMIAGGGCGAAFAEDFQNLQQRAGVERQLAEHEDLRSITASLWQGLQTQSDEVEHALKFQSAMTSAIGHMATTPDQNEAVRRPLLHLLGDGNALLERNGAIAKAAEDYLQSWGNLQPIIDHMATTAGFSEQSTTEFGDIPLPELAARGSAILHSANRLNAWCAWRKARDQAVASGLPSLVAAVESGSLPQGSFRRAFETNYARWWLNAVVDDEPVIRGFVSAVHEKRIHDFRLLDDRFTELTRAWLRAELCSGLPIQDDVHRDSEWGILRRETTKRRRHMPLRELLAKIPTALTKLTPCLLMSPLSIAQYLATDATRFDVVVFDEASQIPVWDAVGAIARGKQVVMVGDPKQLPPTAFFDRAETDLDDEDVESDLESILDECLGANLPTLNLAWHYRSRHESLIAFSNHRYYGGRLVTFPSPVTDDRAVSFHYVQGQYEKGGARINKPEAKALVQDLVARLNSSGFQASKLTIGVVTFNSEQQRLIEDLLDDERRKDPAIEPYFGEMELEPVFVKNLESVQGDERDIMYFSITYGPDLTGAVSMNFGPMNRDGGERRLNVAITRARHELRVFSSLKAEQMDLAKTQAAGVRDLKHFLEFAERGTRALAEANQGSRGDFESPFEEAVASALTSRGWDLHTQVGASTFRVDLAVVHPDAPGRYLSGIECDGATYHRSATARDRDKLREQILRGLGWEILRVWSTDWWIDPENTLDMLDAKLKQVLEISRSKRAEEAVKQAPIETAVTASLNIDGIAAKEPTRAYTEAPEFSGQSIPNPRWDGKCADLFDSLESAEAYARNTAEQPVHKPPVFVESDPTSAVERCDPAAFFDTAYDPVLARMIAHVVEVEGPILDSVLARRIARAHGWQRTGSRIQLRVDSLAAKAHRMTQEDVGRFYWPYGQDPEAPVSYRRATDEAARSVDEICMPELVSLARAIMSSGKSGEEVVISMARELGMQRLRAVSRERFEKVLLTLNVEKEFLSKGVKTR